jgi:hypothetical protein
MQTHWNYPNWATGAEAPWGFLTYERETVRANPFMHPAVGLRQVHEDCDLVNLPDRCSPPNASFVEPSTGIPTRFSAYSTSSGALAQYWTFGDSTASPNASVTHDYAREGFYRVRLRAVGNLAMMDTASTIFAGVTLDVPGGRAGLDPSPLTVSPSPFRKTATLSYRLSRAGVVDLAVYTADGRRVRDLATGYRPEGQYRLHWDGDDALGNRLPSGVYFVRFRGAGMTQMKRVVRLK